MVLEKLFSKTFVFSLLKDIDFMSNIDDAFNKQVLFIDETELI